RAGPSSPECANAPRISRTARPKTATGMAALPAQRRARLVQCSAMPSLELDQHLIRTDETELLPRFLLQDPAIHGSRERPDPPPPLSSVRAFRAPRETLGDSIAAWIGSGSAGFEGLLQLFHEELVDAAGDHLQELLAVRDLVAAAGVVAAAAGALGGVDAVRARRALAVRQLEVRRGAAQVERLHRRR